MTDLDIDRGARVDDTAEYTKADCALAEADIAERARVLGAPAALAFADAAKWEAQGGPLAEATATQRLRSILTDKTGLPAWNAVLELVRGTTTIASPQTSIRVGTSVGQRRRTTVTATSWDEVRKKLPSVLGFPIACYDNCCRLLDSPDDKRPQLAEICLDAALLVTSVEIEDRQHHQELGAWLLRRVQLSAQRTQWSPASRLDACLPAVVEPAYLPSVLYCARRLAPTVPNAAAEQAKLWVYLDDMIAERHGDDLGFDYTDYWRLRATSPQDRAIREAALHPLQALAPEGAYVWGELDEARWHAASIEEVRKRYTRAGHGDNDRGATLLVDVPIGCHHACCEYVQPRLPCNVGGGHPDASVVAKACFDAEGRTTDLDVYRDRYDDADNDPDSP